MEFTREQRAVIEALPGNLLISAAAGSGKTTVLSERIVRRLISGQSDIRSLLVMTFTEAAAANMRRKIASRLREELERSQEAEHRAYLARQLAALPRASISTIHAFCLEVFRSFQYLLADEDGQPLAEPGSGVMDPTTANLQFSDALDRVLSSFYLFCDAVEDGGKESADSLVPAGLPPRGLHPAPFILGQEAESAAGWTASFQVLCDGYSPGRNDRQLRSLVLSLHRFLRSMPDYEQWVLTMLDRLQSAASDFSSSDWADTLVRQMEVLLQKSALAIPGLRRRLDEGLDFVKDARKNLEYTTGYRSLLTWAAGIADRVAQCRTAGTRIDWDQLVTLASELPDPALSRNSRSPEAQEFLDDFQREIAETVHALNGRMGTPKFRATFEFDTNPLFTRRAEDIGRDICAMVPPIRRLMEIVLLSDRVYSALKIQERSIDFSDFEHFALRILRTDEAQAYYRERFAEIYIDECQDTSSIQDEIVASVSGGNVFMVGDVKQSIYRFRHANPTLFLERSRNFSAGIGGLLLPLNHNFRSTGSILNAVNHLFRQILSESSGEIDYDDSQALTPADGAPDGEPVRLLLVDVHKAEEAVQDGEVEEEQDGTALHSASDEEEPGKDGIEGMAIACCVRQLLSEGTDAESIAILGRTHRIIRYVADALGAAGIAHTLADSQGFLATPELLLMESFVSLLDNAAQDLPLAAVMRSRLHADARWPDGFSEESLLSIRVASDTDVGREEKAGPPRLHFHQSVAWYAQNGPDVTIRERVAGFLSWLDSLRAREPYLRLGELLYLVFEQSGYLEYVGQLPDGARRSEELDLFCQWAESFEAGSARGLHKFAAYLSALRKDGVEDSPFAAERPATGRVRLMTIHGSKGLEFDHVFVAGCSKSLGTTISGKLLFSEKSGLGPDYVDPARSVTYPTYARLAMERSLKNASLAEEMRLLYVAMTRAAKHLWLTASVDFDPEKGSPPMARRLRSVRKAAGGNLTLPAHLPLSARSFLDFILLSMAREEGIDWSLVAGSGDPEGLLACVSETASPAFRSQYGQTGQIRLEIRSREDILRTVGLIDRDRTEMAFDPRHVLAERLTGPLDLTGMDAPAYQEARKRFDELLLSEYRYPAAASSAAKVSVSELKRREQAFVQAGESSGDESGATPATWLQGTGLETARIELDETGTRGAGEMTGAERGTAIHAVLRYLDLRSIGDIPDANGIAGQIQRMRTFEMLTQAEADAMMQLAPSFAQYVWSDLGQKVAMAEKAGRLYREMPFTLRFDALDIHKGQPASGFGQGDSTLVQGIIDLWYEDPDTGGVVLVDFKSDKISGSREDIQRTLEERYCVQMDHYTSAIERSTAQAVVSRLIWLFDEGCAYEIGRNADFQR